MNYKNLTIFSIALFLLTIFPISETNAQADQAPCGIVDSINYPIDTNAFYLGQNFGIASPRHQGKFHTAEDWHAGRNATLGQPVRAAARGRVTYSSPLAWGRDGGVIIIEHTFPDGSIFYTQYGHLQQTETVTFPARLSCVEAGDVIGIITSARPAPHLHFEVRSNNPDIPGPGYTREDPETLGWLRPAKMIPNLQVQLIPSFEWHYTTRRSDDNPPPLVLNDQSLLAFDGERVIRVTSDGRVLWRTTLEQPAVSAIGMLANSYITYSNGVFQQVDVESGTLGDLWRVDGLNPDMPPLVRGESLIYHTLDNQLIALTDDNREILWQIADIPRYDYGYAGQTLIALVIENEVWLISNDGALVNRAELENGAQFSDASNGDLIAYTEGGLWRISPDGVWTPLMENVPPGGESTAAYMLDDGRIFLLDGENLLAYSADGLPEWQAHLPEAITGQVTITAYDHVLLITSNHGNIMALRNSGGICGFTHIYGDDHTPYWHNMGTDGILRLMVGDQLLGLDWARFTNEC